MIAECTTLHVGLFNTALNGYFAGAQRFCAGLLLVWWDLSLLQVSFCWYDLFRVYWLGYNNTYYG